jgi:hypothetical protein
MRRTLYLTPLLALAALLTVGAGGAESIPLTAVVGTDDGFTISLADASGSRVTKLDPGTYTIHVSDRSDIHNFHLSGPGVSESTGVDGKEELTWTVTFVDGRYRYVCDAHPATMARSFTVGNPPPLSGGGTEPGELEARVGPGSTITVKRRGTRVRSVAPGRYRVEVRDRTRRDNLHLSGPGVNRRTGVGFVGTIRWTLRLRAGSKYRYRSDPHPRLRGSFRTTG